METYDIKLSVVVRLAGAAERFAMAGAESRIRDALEYAGFENCVVIATDADPVPAPPPPPAPPEPPAGAKIGESGLPWVEDDGGRAAAGYKGSAGDCVARSIAIVTGRPYAEVYERLAKGNASQRVTKRDRRRKITRHAETARSGIFVKRKWFKDYMAELGLVFTPTMAIGSGCTVHLAAGELPAGRLIVSLSKHYAAVIDGVLHDTFDCQRRTYEVGRKDGVYYKRTFDRCVYGYWNRP